VQRPCSRLLVSNFPRLSCDKTSVHTPIIDLVPAISLFLICFSVYLLCRFNSGKRIVKCVRWRSWSFSQSHTLRYKALVRYATPCIWFTYWN
jgi:hypothetical protein